MAGVDPSVGRRLSHSSILAAGGSPSSVTAQPKITASAVGSILSEWRTPKMIMKKASRVMPTSRRPRAVMRCRSRTVTIHPDWTFGKRDGRVVGDRYGRCGIAKWPLSGEDHPRRGLLCAAASSRECTPSVCVSLMRPPSVDKTCRSARALIQSERARRWLVRVRLRRTCAAGGADGTS